MQQYGNQQVPGGFQRPGSTTSFAGQPAPPPAYGALQGFQPSASPSVNQSQWAPPTQSPTSMQQQWNQSPPQQQTWGQNAQAPPHPPQQQAAGGYNPGTYGAMSGAFTQSVQGAVLPSQNQPQSNMGSVPPPPPPKPGQFQGSMQPQQPQQGQNSQSWNQQPAYASQQASQDFQAQLQNTGFTQQNHTGQYNQQGQPMLMQQGQQGFQQMQNQTQPAPPQSYNTAAPPPPSATPGGSYFPPSSNRPTSGYDSDPSGTYNTPQSAVSQTPPLSVLSPNEQHPVYIPPSLTGQGVQSYMPANTNPLPGVYVPPPPDIPAWSQADHAPGQGGAKKFRYTKPNPQPQFQQGPQQQAFQGGMGTQPPVQQPGQHYQPQQPMHMPQSQQGFGQQPAQPMQHQYQHQQFSQQTQSPPQQPQYGQQMQPPPQQPQYGQQPMQQGQFQQNPMPQQFQPQGVNPQQQQSYGAQNVSQQPPIPAPYGNVSQPAPQQDWQAQGQQGGQNQIIQAPKPVHGQLQAQATQHLFNAHTEQSPPVSHSTPVSPIHQKRNSVFGGGQGGGALGRTDSISSIMGRAPASNSKTSTPVQRGPSPPAPAVAASALGRGGPSDWEHFGSPEDEIDDEEFFGPKAKEDSHHTDSVELPTAPSPPLNDSVEEWPTPPAPAPLNVDRPTSSFQHEHHKPTPPPKAPEAPLPHGPYMHEAPAQKSPDTVRTSHEWPAVQETHVHQPAEATPVQGFVMDHGGWVPPVQSSIPQREPSVKKAVSPPPASNPVMDNGGWGQAQPAKPQEPTHMSKEPESSFVMDDGGWGAAQAIPATKSQEQQRKMHSPSPRTGGIVIDEGRYGVSQSGALAQLPKPQHEQAPKNNESPTARDLIPDIDPWYAGSLERYIGMLRQEAAAHDVEDKKKVFTDFLAAESEIRGIEYYRTPPAPIEPFNSHRGSIPISALEEQDPAIRRPVRKMTVTVPSNSFSMEPASEEYSPGGRPILKRKPTLTSHASNVSTEQSFNMSAGHEETTPVREFQHGPPSPVKAAMDTTTRQTDSPAHRGYRPYSIIGSGSEPSNQSATILTPTSSTGDEFNRAMQSPEQPIEPSQPPPQQEPQYKPYSPGENIVTSATTAIQSHEHRQSLSYAVAPLQVSHKGDEIFFAGPEEPEPSSKPASKATTASSNPQTFSDHGIDIPAPLNPSGGASTATAPTPAPTNTSSPALATLFSLLPKTISPPAPHPTLANLETLLSTQPADFTFLATLTTTYETSAAALRSTLDRERRARQEESEARTDQLFNDNEISYADIGSLEDEFKAEEARRKAKEDREEYARFVEGVFDKGYEQLQEGVRALMGGVGECEKLFDASGAGLGALEGREGAPPATIAVIDMLVRFHEQVELRHEKITGLVAERDKRYKKTEIQPLYQAGNIAKMKNVERHFENAERQASLRAKSERAERVAELVRGVEEAVVRAVGANQGARDEIVALLAKISPQDVKAENAASVIGKADQSLKALAQSSKELMTRFNEVELQLNSAVIEAEIAQVKAENLGQEKEKPRVGGLEAELKEGEQRLKGELERRLGVLEEDLREGEGLVRERLVGVEGRSGSVGGGAAPLSGEEEKAARLKAALEEAKRRNAR